MLGLLEASCLVVTAAAKMNLAVAAAQKVATHLMATQMMSSSSQQEQQQHAVGAAASTGLAGIDSSMGLTVTAAGTQMMRVLLNLMLRTLVWHASLMSSSSRRLLPSRQQGQGEASSRYRWQSRRQWRCSCWRQRLGRHCRLWQSV